jgi:hypothetical protein
MSARVIPFPLPSRPYNGTVRVMGDKITGFEVGHESYSGNSWGSFSGPYSTGQEAITAAYVLNRDVYYGGCDISICDAALQDRDLESPAPRSREDF